ncbi:MAG: ferredoxin reductase family protein [Chloroflexota bacterium]
MANVRARQRLAPSRTVDTRTAHGHRHRAATGWFVWLVILANAVMTIVLWARGGNVSGVHSGAALLNSLGRITGLLGTYLLLLQVLLLARFPWIERLTGFDRLTVWHRLNGKVCLYLILAHVALTTIGYALTDRVSISREASLLLQNYPGMVTAMIGTALLIVVVVTSLIIVRRRLRYETWYLVHLTAYAAIYLSWTHQLPTGNEFLTNPATATYWTTLYLITLALLVIFRIVQPVYRGFWHRMHVEEVTVAGRNVVSLHITGRHLDRLDARAGQFFLWRFLTRGRWWESHPFSLSAAPDGRSLRITVKNSGDFTSRIGEIVPGTAVLAEGPFGVFTDDVRRRDRVALIAGGIGITPIRALLEEMSCDLVLVYRVLREDDLVFRDELEELAWDRQMPLFYVVGDHAVPVGERLMSPEHLGELIPDIAERDVYLCGPPVMTDILEQNVLRAGVQRKHIHIERFAL